MITNVPGPQLTAYMLGARLLEIYPLVPLYANQAVGIALFSYDGGLYWGFNSDWDTVPDLHDMVEMIQSEFELLRKTSLGGSTTRTSPRRRRTRAPSKPPPARPPM